MKKIRSTELYKFLDNKGLIGASAIEIAIAKNEYRKEYKRKWKRSHLKLKPELRPNFTKKELELISKSAKSRGLSNTNFIKQSALNEASKTKLIPNKDELLSILQKVSMAGILVTNTISQNNKIGEMVEADTLLMEAEKLLMIYLGYDR